jgi:hypothetical protein
MLSRALGLVIGYSAGMADVVVQAGQQGGRQITQATRGCIAAAVPVVVRMLLQDVPVTDLIKEHVNLDALVADLDLDALAARLDADAMASRVDLEALIDRVDLVSLAERVIIAIDLPGIIRESTLSVTTQTVRGLRLKGIEADQAMSRLRERLMLRWPPSLSAEATP